jgi:hypothetical protein
VAAVGDDQLAVGMADVVGQLVAPPGRVDPHRGGAHQGGAGDPEQEFGHIVEEDADVEGAGPALGQRHRRPDSSGVDELGPRIALGLEQQCRVVVTGPGPQEAGNRLFAHVPLLPGFADAGSDHNEDNGWQTFRCPWGDPAAAELMA